MFLKIRKSGSQTEGIDKVFGLYGREIVMYREVLPLLDNFVSNNSKNGDKQKFIDMFPNFFGSGEVNGDLILVFEDILDGEKIVSYICRKSY